VGNEPQKPWRDSLGVLDEELRPLPDNYLTPVVLCYFEGRTHVQAGRLLGWPAATVKGRRARACKLLRRRLARRGVTLSAALISGSGRNCVGRGAGPAPRFHDGDCSAELCTFGDTINVQSGRILVQGQLPQNPTPPDEPLHERSENQSDNSN
jgi:hypothetical protein